MTFISIGPEWENTQLKEKKQKKRNKKSKDPSKDPCCLYTILGRKKKRSGESL